jgi:hypothetical protein
MNCSQARDAILVAELRDLTAGTDDLAVHLRTCADCRGRIDDVAAQTAVLASAVRRRVRRRRSRRLVLVAGAPIAAAALVAVAFRATHDDSAPKIARSSSALPVARRVSLTLGPGQTAAVLRTADTTVTVIWLTGAGQ